MAQARDTDPASILTPRELESMRLLQDVYGGMARQSADELGRVLELDDETRGRLVGNLGLKLAEVDFEQRREVSQKLDEVAAILGGTVASGSGMIQVPEAVVLELSSHTRSDVDDVVAPGLELAGDELAADPEETTEQELTAVQRTWFGKLYDPLSVRKIAAATAEQRTELVDGISGIYVDLSIRRIGKAAKEKRAEQLKELMSGKDMKTIAAEHGENHLALRSGLMKMTESIRTRVPEEDLMALVPEIELSPEEQEEAAAEARAEANEPVPLTIEQTRWLEKLVEGSEVVDSVNGMNPQQRSQLALRLSQFLYPAIVRRLGPERSRIRVRTMTTFLEGMSVSEIAQARTITEMAVKDELLHARNRMKDTTPKEKLLTLVAEARNFTLTEE
jgi:hypothetical protein